MVAWRLILLVVLTALPAFGQSGTSVSPRLAPDTVMLEVVAVRASDNPPPEVASPVATESLPAPMRAKDPASGDGQAQPVPENRTLPQNASPTSAMPVSQNTPSQAPPSSVSDDGLDSVRPALSDLNYRFFQRVSGSRLPVAFQEETHIEVNPDYVLHVMPVSVEKNGMVRLNVRLELRSKQEGRPSRNAISTTLVTLPQRLFKLRGLKIESGELVVVMKVSR